ncbi:MAG: hypothetical protein KAI71_03700 [Candidatus Pacebacteria bacterium]|nr:hypothetical protein [Candidatus Paceibacterota bacterium]
MKKNNFDKKLIKETRKVIDQQIGLVIKLVTILVFMLVAIYIFFNIDPVESDIPDYERLTENNSSEYNREIKRIKRETEELLKNNQLDIMEEGESFLSGDFYEKRNKDPFYKIY